MVKIKGNCVGCGRCVIICPNGIEMKEGLAVIKDEKAACLKDAINACPVNVIVD